MSTEPLLSEFADDPEMADLLRSFVAGLGATCDQLELALRDGDTDTVRRIGHQLKGSGGGYGYPALSAAGAELEKAVNRAGNAGPAVRAAADHLIQLCRRAGV